MRRDFDSPEFFYEVRKNENLYKIFWLNILIIIILRINIQLKILLINCVCNNIDIKSLDKNE